MEKDIEELDLSRNRFEKLEDIALVCSALPKLKSLRISGNRFNTLSVSSSQGFNNITSLEIGNVLMNWTDLTALLALFPAVTTLIAPHNNIAHIPSPPPFAASLTALDLSYNNLATFASVSSLSYLPNLKTLILAHNTISTLSTSPNTVFPVLNRLDLGYNALPSFSTLDALPTAAPNLTSLRISHNPLYTGATLDDAHMLTIGRLPAGVTILNHSTITAKERENAEIWYLSQIAREVAASPDKREQILANHRRWDELCKLHGEPAVAMEKGESEKTLAAKLVEMEFFCGEKVEKRKVPKGTPVSTLRGMVGRWFGMSPLRVRLVCTQAGEEVVLSEVDDTRELGMHVEEGKGRVVVRVESM